MQRKQPGEEGYDPYEYDDEGIDVGKYMQTPDVLQESRLNSNKTEIHNAVDTGHTT